jgi:putative SOS response-associated peptidase YedK
MCGRFTLTSDLKAIAERFSAALSTASEKTSPRYNVAPTQNIIVVNDDGQRCITIMRWGLSGRSDGVLSGQQNGELACSRHAG